MIDLTNMKAPGWSRLVADLAAPAPDDRIFLARLLGVLGQVSTARQGVLYTIASAPKGERPDEPTPDIEPKAVLVWPIAPETAAAIDRGLTFDVALPDAQVERAPDARNVARRAALTRQVQVFGLENADLLYDGSANKGYLIAVPILGAMSGESAAGPVAAVVTLLTDGRSRQALQTTLALLEVLAGYVHTHAAMQQLRRTRAASASLDLASRLISSINQAPSFKGAALQLVNDLSRQLAAERVAFAWVDGWSARGDSQPGRLRSHVLAITDTENVDRRMIAVQKLEAAMDECLDQEQPILYPPPPAQGAGADVLLSQAVVHAHRELAAADARLKVTSLPVRVDDRVIGVVTIETTQAGTVELSTLELLQAALDLVAPVLRVRYNDDRWLYERAYDSMLKAGVWLVGPKHTLWKLAGIAIVVATLCAIFIRIPYRVGAPMSLEPREPRTISVPFDGVLRTLGPGIEPGATVAAGDVLAEMDTTELVLNSLDAQAQLTEAAKKADEALKKNELAEAQQAQAKADQAKAKLDLYTDRMSRAKLRSPIAGKIIAGDVKDRVGSTVQIGQSVFQIADLSDMVVTIKVDDRDISFIKEGMTGEFTTKADPAREFPFVVEKIVPLSQAKDGTNSFVIRAKLQQAAAWFRPGMEGIAKFNTEKRSLAWIAGRRVVDQLRLWLWW